MEFSENDTIENIAASIIDNGDNDDNDSDDPLALAQSDLDDVLPHTGDEDGDGEVTSILDEPHDEAQKPDPKDLDGVSGDHIFTVKVDGLEQKVTLDELRRGYSGQSFIQKGMKDAAETKKQVVAVYEALKTEREQLAQLAYSLQSGKIPLQPPQKPKSDLLDKDPIGYLEARLKYDDELEAFNSAQKSLRNIEVVQLQAKEAENSAYTSEEFRKLSMAIPGFSKPETATKLKDALFATGMDTYGFDEEELGSITDHRMVVVLHDAAKYRRIMAGKSKESPAAQRQAVPTVRVAGKTGSRTNGSTSTEKIMARMKETGSDDDVARFLLT